MFGHEGPIADQVITDGTREVLGAEQGGAARPLQGLGGEGRKHPHRIHLAGDEGRRRGARLQGHKGDVLLGHAGLLHAQQQQVMVNGALLGGHLFALEVGHAANPGRRNDLVIATGDVVGEHHLQIGASGERRNRVAQGLAVAIQLAGVEGVDRIEVAVKPGKAHRHSGSTEVPPLLAHLPGKPARPGAVANPHRRLANRGAWFAAAAQAGANHPGEQQVIQRAQTKGPGAETGHADGSKRWLKQLLERKM